MTKAYSSNLSYDQFKLIEALLPAARPGGRPRSVCLWSILNGIFYVVVNSCKWRDLPDDLPPWQTVYTYFRNWRTDGTWQAIHQRLRSWTRVVAGRAESPSEVINDSQSVPTATMVNQAVGYDGGKQIKGRKRHVIVDTLGLVMTVLVTAASKPERAGIKQAFQNLMKLKRQVARLYLVWADGGYSGQPFLRWAMDTFRLVVAVVLRPQQSKGFVLLKAMGGGAHLWLVELVSAAQQGL